ncbi:MAG: DUF1232 domain-containing protein [Ignavibacteriaceae bacterium]
MNIAQKDFYQKLRLNINKWIDTNVGKNHKWTEFILLAPDLFHLLCKLTIDSDVPSSKKVKLGAVILYFISPIDILPEAFLGPIGYLDDISLAAYILNDLLLNVDPKIIRRNWAGESDVLDIIKTILVNFENFLGKKLWSKIRKRF